jgi:transcriptional regulator with XRE-family HTH domain
LGWSREALAYRSGLSWSAIEQIESGRRTNARPGTLVALARALNVSVDYLLGGSPLPLLHHEALIYASENQFIASVVPFVENALARSEPVLVVTPAPNIEALKKVLGEDAARLEFAESRDWYRAPQEALAAYRRFAQQKADDGFPWCYVVGEPLWSSSDDAVLAWAAYESMFNVLFDSTPLSVICPYDLRSCPASVIDIARQTHPHLRTGTESAANAAYMDPEDFVFTTYRPG